MKRRWLSSDQKAEQAQRLAAWQALSPSEQLAALDARLGKNQGALKQRKRLAKLLETK